jgi:hypothetical protein
VALLAFPLSASTIVLEAEDYVAYHNAGGSAMYVTGCSGASGGYAVEGYDAVGDWIEVLWDVSESGSYTDTLRTAGATYGLWSDHTATLFGAGPAGNNLVSSFSTYGLGIG